MRITGVSGSEARSREVLIRNAGQVKKLPLRESCGEARKPMRCRNNRKIIQLQGLKCVGKKREQAVESGIPTVDI